jgi:hypothetical protein
LLLAKLLFDHLVGGHLLAAARQQIFWKRARQTSLAAGSASDRPKPNTTAAILSILGYIDMASPNAFPRTSKRKHERRRIRSL